MKRNALVCLSIGAMLGALYPAAPALARQAAAAADTSQPAAPAKGDTTTVTIKGKKTVNKADRQVYDLSQKPDSETASVADTLNKVPGVSVDPSGNVTLRGQQVRIYLNGRPSLMLSGDNRGQALQAMPSAYLGSIEVISNPGAQFASDSSDPIINLVTKRKGPTGMFGSVTARQNSTGRGALSAWVDYTAGDVNLSVYPSSYGTLSHGRYGADLKDFDSGHALTAETQSNGASQSRDRGVFVGANLEDNLGQDDVVSAGLNYDHGTGTYSGQSHTRIYDGTGQATDIHDTALLGDYAYGSQTLTLGYTHYGKKPDETLKIDGSLASSRDQGGTENDVTYARSPVPADTGTRVDTKSHDGKVRSARLSADYNTVLGDDQVAVGMQVVHDESRLLALAFGPDTLGTPLTPETLLDNDFSYRQTVSAVYGTYQREFTDALTVLGGLRAETWTLNTLDATADTRNRLTYTQLNPSLFATYVLSPKRKLRFSYVRHQQRPDPADLNPHLVYNASTSVTLGNPALKPQQNDTFESAYEYQDDRLNYAFRGFYRRDDHLIARNSFFIPDPQNAGNLVLESTHENYRFQTADGLSGNVNRRVDDHLTLSGDATVTFSAIRNPDITGAQRGTSLGGSATATYSIADEHELSVTWKLNGKSFFGQGYVRPSSAMSLQYKRPLMPKLDIIVSFDNLLRTAKAARITATPLIQGYTVGSQEAPTFYIALTRHFSHMNPVAPTP